MRECDTILQSHVLQHHPVHISQDICDLHLKLSRRQPLNASCIDGIQKKSA